MIIGGSKKDVIKNIEQNVLNNELNKKVEVNDAVLSDEEISKLLDTFYKNKSKKIRYGIKHAAANMTVSKYMKLLDKDIIINGAEKLKNIDLSKGAIITSNHFNPLDTFIIRKLVEKVLKKDLYIVIQDTNLAMPGSLGFLMNYTNVIPVSKSPTYLAGTFKENLRKVLNAGNIVLIYPEEEMWFNYKKPRPGKIGAYHYACKYNVPIIPCFVEMQNTDKIGDDGFYVQRYILHVMKPLYPDTSFDFKAQKEDLRKRDYDLKVAKYEEVYGKKFDDKFEIEEDIAGWN